MRVRLSPKTSLLLSIVAICFLTISQSALRTKTAEARERIAPQEPVAQPSASATPALQHPTPKSRSTLRRIFDFLRCEPAKRKMEQQLVKTGPQFPTSYNMSDFSFPAMVQGNEPFLMLYESELQSKTLMQIEVKDVEPFVQEFAGTGRGQRRESMFTLPERFGDKPQAALISIKSTTTVDPRGKELAYLRLYALGMGKEALGSVPVDVSYQPYKINTSRKEPLNYTYQSRKSYDDVKSDFWRVRISKGLRKPSQVFSEELGALRAKEPRSGQWYGRRNRGKGSEFSLGEHDFHLNARVRGHWIVVWSADDSIFVE